MNEIGGVRGDDAVLAGQFGDFVLEFLALAAQSDFVEQIANTARRPQPRDEFVIVDGVGEFHVVGEAFVFAAHGPFDLNRAIAVAGVTADENELLALEQVRHGRWVEL